MTPSRPILTWFCLAFCLPALTAQAADKPIELFDGKSLEAWDFKTPKERSRWTIGIAALKADDPAALSVTKPADGETPQLVNAAGGGVDLFTRAKFGSCRIELELMVPKGSNSGVYVLGEYEVQILDSFGKETIGAGDLGGLYGAAAPKVNASRAPGEWQTLVIDFDAPKFDGDRKVANARFVKVVLNGKTIHENVEMQGPTPSGVTGKEAPTGPLMFQGDHGPVAFRNIRLTPR